MGTDFKYDVAISFLAQDEALATELNDLLQDRMSVFLYSKRQEEIAGTDGELKFNAVFGQQSRFVVVLYRAGWGQSPFTRIEETAIRNRAFRHGYDFVKFVPLDDPPKVPEWLPKAQIWLSLKRWGIEGVASVIEARVQELGGQPHEEGVLERAARLNREIEFTRDRERFLRSPDAVKAANIEYEALCESLEAHARAVTESVGFSIHVLRERGRVIVSGLAPFSMTVEWRARYANTLDESEFKVSFWRQEDRRLSARDARMTSASVYVLDLARNGAVGWATSGASARSGKALGEHLLKEYMDLAGRN